MQPTTACPSTPVPVVEQDAVPDEVARLATAYFAPLLTLLDQHLDRRLVHTFAATTVNLIRHRGRELSLLLTELGELLLGGPHAPAGVKRLWRLLKSPKWTAQLVSDWVLTQADQAVAAACARDGEALLVLDGSVIEKPFAHKLEGLMRVRSAHARILERASGGPPRKPPLLVSGFGWVGAVVTGFTGSLTLARLHGYSSKAPGDEAVQQREAETHLLWPLLARWGRQVLVVLDRGFAGREFLGRLLERQARWIVRWRRDYHLIGPGGEEAAASRLTQRVRSKWVVEVYSPYTRQTQRLGIAAVPVCLVGNPTPLWLVVIRRKGHDSWWLLTTEDASTPAGATRIVLAYARRWQVEWAFRYGKAELGVGSVRVRRWAYGQKLWAIAELVHAFLLHLLVLDEGLLRRLLRWCHRTGRKWQAVVAPLYRLRHALANLWQHHPPTLAWPP